MSQPEAIDSSAKARKLLRAMRSERLRSAAKACMAAGWKPSIDGSTHLRLTSPDGKTRVSLSTTAYDGPGAYETMARLRRAGAPVGSRGGKA